jgi:xanthine dehydrogenase/oxidase
METTSREITVFINGKKHLIKEGNVDPRMTLIAYLRSNGLTGTKLGCGEGGCGACTVMISKFDHLTNSVKHLSSNACLTPICALDGYAVTTVEGIGGMRQGLHPVQKRVSSMHGSQCGFCTPGIVMAIYTQLRSKPDSTPHEIEESLDGNLCRCTGYRPILDAAKSLSNNKSGCCGGATSSAGGCCGGAGDNSSCCKDQTDCGSGGACCSKSVSSTEKVIAEKPSLAEELTASNYTEPIFPPSLVRYEYRAVTLKGEFATWHQPLTLSGLIGIKSEFPSAKLVVGNTEVGIEVKFKGSDYPVLVNPSHVPELQVLDFNGAGENAGMTIGAAVTLNRLRDFISDLDVRIPSESKHMLRGYEAIKHMFTWFASNHIRNVACVGGNIINASPISDLNPLLMACGAMLKLTSVDGTRSVPATSFFLAYRKVDMKPNEILESVFIPATKSNEYVLPFKQARRREDDISIVTSGIRFLLEKQDDNVVIKESTLSFGGMAPITVCAPKTTEALNDKVWSYNTIESVLPIMRQEFALPDQVPGGQSEFRTSLTLSFLMKAYLIISAQLDDAHKNSIPANEVSGAKNFITEEKASSRGEQLYVERLNGEGLQHARPVPHAPNTDSIEKRIVGQPVMHKSAEAQVSGEAKYAWDTMLPSHGLHAALVTSTKAHARIVSLDTSEAEACPGFVAYFGAKDIPGHNEMGPIVHDEELFVENEVKHFGAVIGMVVAASHEEALAAAKKVKIQYEDLPAIISIEDAIAGDSFFPIHHEIRKGDVNAARGDSDFVVEGTVKMGGQEHFYLETNCSVVTPLDNGFLEVLSSTQNVNETQKYCAAICGIPISKVNARCKRMGGGFGGKESRSVFVACAASVAAYKLNRPVSLNIERDLDMSITGQRHAFIMKYSAGCKKDGSLTFLQAEVFNNAGYSLDLSSSIMDRALFHSDNVYKWPSVHLRGNVCKTNQPSHTAYRGFGGPQGLLFCETVIQHLSSVSGIDVKILRENNMYSEGDRTHFNQLLEDFYVPKLWKELHTIAEIEKRQEAVAEFNGNNRWRKRGISILPTKFGINFTAKFLNQGGALVHVHTDGSVLVAHGGKFIFVDVLLAFSCFD